MIIQIALSIGLLLYSISTFLYLYRILKGPTTSDKVVALDSIGMNLVAIVALLSMFYDTNAFLDVILLIALLAFIGTVSFAKFIEKGKVIDRERDN
ncbi:MULTISPECIES: Na(+)/H(+) antiporter subunit F1 [Listeria]|uniref:Monovalent cation/H+ antiporter subunit F n=5 Tax=Listeria TaxID=1637 RepID=A0A7X0X4P5_LISSE|nr:MULTISPECIES: Na(+)/H(+) antiporter subunit F1 [Listeria]EFS02254.1 Na(+)/H(+) antiporter subunit F [Listeria seeligeri FSL S4-171]AHI56817.1 cation:proton antiporter [Listeria ivanovii WSLC3009]AIS60702.1 monovalent cation/H+ antiporter subunit F [Listeria ivanovii subsp. londoniensis]AIS63528.1 monovalent cation/H+ antiporter subunit F [Listeria ivanovii subsp. londoniensis]AIS66234.1 monovalent cation/H+ antiporter subunit F [Listeria ivanovii subsp. ivanovii]